MNTHAIHTATDFSTEQINPAWRGKKKKLLENAYAAMHNQSACGALHQVHMDIGSWDNNQTALNKQLDTEGKTEDLY